MSIWHTLKATWDGLLGRAEELYGKSHGDAAAEVRGEAHVAEAEAEEAEDREAGRGERHRGHGPASEPMRPPGEDVTGR